ncbi:Trihelix transcription factor [Actinidia chinensis var. chinensis]|uniref:Trihelix transcription factor n=1 Tax=Actinidia chinensis var. chinensis TaxID=1590841 RepID=A0A2R6QPK1_ACTCC|nr:Trihelix transcription factor [Actinidia chinensis var. chinensis]
MASSSSPPQTHHLALPAPPNPSSAVSARRLPPPCWSHDETAALIDAYRDKWYSLRRGNLRAPHWQEVADAVTARCPPPPSGGNPPKTAVQCRHKMEKLRKRYRAELQRALTFPKGKRFASSWVHFNRMDSMEKGPSNSTTVVEDEDNDQEEDDDDEDLYQSVKRGVPPNRAVYESMSNGIGSRNGVRIKFSGKSSVPPKMYSKFDGKPYTHVGASPNLASARVVGDGFSKNSVLGKRRGGDGGEGVGRKREGEPVAEMVAAVKALGDGIVRMERMKMDMAREVEAMRMEMEMKRTEMILDSQQRIVEAFAKAFSEKRNKKAKRMSSPEA